MCYKDFNDHPFPVANQTTPAEVNFRYNGLQEWIGRGLNYFWFDHNWAFTVPGPLMPYDSTADYEGMSGQVWGSQVMLVELLLVLGLLRVLMLLLVLLLVVALTCGS